MKLGVVTKTMLLTGGLVALALGASNLWTFERINPEIERQELETLGAAARAASVRFTSALESMRTDLVQLADTPPVAALPRLRKGIDPVDGSSEAQWRSRLETIAAGFLRAQPRYLQIRLIGVADGGREIVRVRRAASGEIATVHGADLQQRAGADYFQDGIRLRKGEILLSEINLNREHGEIQEPHIPVIRAITPVVTPDGGVYGVLVINLDLTRTFAEIVHGVDQQEGLGQGQELRVANEQGYFLLHPDPARTFGFDLGHDERIQNELPGLSDLLRGRSRERSTRLVGSEVVTAVERVTFDPTRPDRFVLFALSEPRVETLAISSQVRRESLALAVGLILFSGICVFGLGRSVMHTIGAEPVEIEEITARVADGDLSIRFEDANEEVGGIYGSVRRMVDALRERTERLDAQIRLRDRSARISELSQGESDLAVLANATIAELARFTDAGAGAFYTSSPEVSGEGIDLVLSGSYGRSHPFDARAPLPGLVRQCAEERRTIVLDPAPPGYAPIESGVGRGMPQSVILVPVVFAEELQGVIELAAFERFDPADRDLLEHVSTSLGAVISSIADRTRIEGLYHEAQRLQEEAQTQAEELQASNEELAEKSEALEEQRAELESQTEELRVANEEGEQRAEELRLANEALAREKNELDRARDQVEAKSRDLEAASRYKSEFLANMSHELRTPLNSLLILAKSLASNETGNLDEDQVQCAQVIHEAGNDLLTLINDILDLSKVEAGRLDIVSAPVAPSQVAQAMRRQFNPTAAQKGLELRIEVADGLPETIVTDVARVEQILRNLLANACKFTNAGHVALRVQPTEPATVFANPDLGAGSIALAVEDTGIGIPLDKQQAIFEAFQQADGSTSRRFGGTGLGLTISRELARLLGGEIHVRSEPGQGSAFTLYLPIAGPPVGEHETKSREISSAAEEATAAAEPEQPLADDRDAVQKGDKLMLLVEDDLRFAEILMDRSRRQGFQCIVVATGAGALAMLSRFDPTAVVLDLGLPDMDGSRVLEHLRSQPATANVPVHVISARDEASFHAPDGAVRFTRKPVQPDTLDAIFADLGRASEGQPQYVLVVEDVEQDRRDTVAMLARRRVEVAEATSGAEATERLRSERFDCVILDFQLGDTNAVRLLEDLVRDGEVDLPPVVVYTARDLTEDEHRVLRSHAHAVVVKGALAAERLLDEVSLFLHAVDRALPDTVRPAPRASSDVSLTGRKVLLVDDDLRNTFALSRSLRAEGLEVTIAENGQMALDKLEADPGIELVVMDVMMPVMDGLEATRRIRSRKEWAALPVIALTAGAMQEHRAQSLEAGVDDHLTKPVEIERLLATIRLWLSRA